ncbi:hypothetical protein DFH09DRAFT_1188021 [Mycena vulgaris]|nr:hypothetical protein DFH09DRAFT_1188021 [Mycena vulgaris]
MQFLTIVSLALVSCAASIFAAPALSSFKITININELAPGTSARIAEHTSLSAPNLERSGPCNDDADCSGAGCVCNAQFSFCMPEEAMMDLHARPQHDHGIIELRITGATFASKRDA